MIQGAELGLKDAIIYMCLGDHEVWFFVTKWQIPPQPKTAHFLFFICFALARLAGKD